MKGFYITGKNGSYIELEDGRFADTVSGQTSERDAHQALESLKNIMTHASGSPLASSMSVSEFEQYVGA